jgi:hypothetical protein
MSLAWGSVFVGIIIGWLLSGVLGRVLSKATG